ncbi:hypothetical protein ID866_5917 [Astraeus odoratus]|nr:hypothetical protein ID866_5917 [Astraeus odoratus]
MPPRTTRNSTGQRVATDVPRRTRRTKAIVPLAPLAPSVPPVPAVTTDEDADDGYADKVKWLKCRDQYGVPVIVKYSETGEGTHIIWNWAEYEEENASAAMNEDDDSMQEDVATPPPTTPGTTLQTPEQQQPYDAGSVLGTPVKRARPLQPSPTRFWGGHVPHAHEHPGLYRESNGDFRIIFDHEVGSSVNLSREQVEQRQTTNDQRIFVEQVKKLMAERDALREETNCSDAGGRDMVTDQPTVKRHVQTAGTDGTILLAGQPIHRPCHRVHAGQRTQADFITGPERERLNRCGRRMLGPEATILIDHNFCAGGRSDLPMRLKRWEIPEADEEMEDDSTKKTPLSDARRHLNMVDRRHHLAARRLGPEGTELVL